MSFLVFGILGDVFEQNSIVKGVREDDWTTALAIIASIVYKTLLI